LLTQSILRQPEVESHKVNRLPFADPRSLHIVEVLIFQQGFHYLQS
jgi:hypothetical protein